MGIVLAFVVLLFVLWAVRVAALPVITAVSGMGTSAIAVMPLSHALTLSDATPASARWSASAWASTMPCSSSTGTAPT